MVVMQKKTAFSQTFYRMIQAMMVTTGTFSENLTERNYDLGKELLLKKSRRSEEKRQEKEDSKTSYMGDFLVGFVRCTLL